MRRRDRGEEKSIRGGKNEGERRQMKRELLAKVRGKRTRDGKGFTTLCNSMPKSVI